MGAMIWFVPTFGGLARIRCWHCAAMTRHITGRGKSANALALSGNLLHMDLAESYRRGPLKCISCGRID